MIKYNIVNEALMRHLGERKTAPVDAVPTPFPSWNKMCGEEGGLVGPARGWLVVIGGASGTGKSNTLYNIIAEALRRGETAGGINFEMTTMQAVTRLASISSGIPSWTLNQGPHFSKDAWKKATDHIASLPGKLLINGPAVFSLRDVEESFKVLSDKGARLVGVDYGQLIKPDNGSASDIRARSECVADRLWELTVKYQTLTYVLSQLNRENSKKREAGPRKEALQGGSSWENNANQVILLNHTVRAHTEDFRFERTELLGDKNRHGPSRFTLPVRWNHECHRLEEFDPSADTNDYIEPKKSDEDDDGCDPSEPEAGLPF